MPTPRLQTLSLTKLFHPHRADIPTAPTTDACDFLAKQGD